MTFDLRERISRHWQELERTNDMHGWQDDVYSTEVGHQYFRECSPAERLMFQELRCYWWTSGFVPEYRVGNYYIDFADPLKKIAIEVDGKQWHSDTKRDAKKDSCLRKQGWTVYRIEAAGLLRSYQNVFSNWFGCGPDQISSEYSRKHYDSDWRWQMNMDLAQFWKHHADKEATCLVKWIGHKHFGTEVW